MSEQLAVPGGEALEMHPIHLLRYNAQTFGYICLLTRRYPSFSGE